MAKIWNITDHPRTDAPGVTWMVLGRAIKPGRFVRIPDERLTHAHKVHKDVEAGNLYIGEQPPPDYVKAKKPPRVVLDKGVIRSHGAVPAEAIAAEASAIMEKVLTEEVAVEESFSVRRRSHR